MEKMFIFLILKVTICAAQLGKPCGRTITGQTEGEVASPGYPDNFYPSSENCTYVIIAPPNHVIVYSSTFMDLEGPDEQSGRCLFDALNIYDDDAQTNSLCGKQILYPNATSSNTLRIEFISDFAKEAPGFHLRWHTLDVDERPIRLSCNFDDPISLCAGWTNARSYLWYFTREHTDSANTGPEFDHTTGNASGKYAYIEASGAQRNSTAILQSPAILSQRNADDRCVRFWYHMYGKGIGALRVFLMENIELKTMIVEFSGNRGDAWQEAKETITLRSLMSTISFEATRGMNYTSDIAIDDISITDGPCDDGDRNLDISRPPIGGPPIRFPNSILPRACATVFESARCPQDCDLKCDNFFDLDFTSCSRACYLNCACPQLTPIFHEGRCVDFSECPDSDVLIAFGTNDTPTDGDTTPQIANSATATTTQQELVRTTAVDLEKKKEIIHDELIEKILHGIKAFLSSRNNGES